MKAQIILNSNLWLARVGWVFGESWARVRRELGESFCHMSICISNESSDHSKFKFTIGESWARVGWELGESWVRVRWELGESFCHISICISNESSDHSKFKFTIGESWARVGWEWGESWARVFVTYQYVYQTKAQIILNSNLWLARVGRDFLSFWKKGNFEGGGIYCFWA